MLLISKKGFTTSTTTTLVPFSHPLSFCIICAKIIVKLVHWVLDFLTNLYHIFFIVFDKLITKFVSCLFCTLLWFLNKLTIKH